MINFIGRAAFENPAFVVLPIGGAYGNGQRALLEQTLQLRLAQIIGLLGNVADPLLAVGPANEGRNIPVWVVGVILLCWHSVRGLIKHIL